LKKLRVARVATPVLILSGISEMDSKVRSFGFGADDYVTKPFHREELLARLRVALRHRGGAGRAPQVVRTATLTIDLDRRLVMRAEEEVHLTRKED
ncbi:response regulator, partial [Escherichia coli]|nr:response regulator [Escherichia coli]